MNIDKMDDRGHDWRRWNSTQTQTNHRREKNVSNLIYCPATFRASEKMTSWVRVQERLVNWGFYLPLAISWRKGEAWTDYLLFEGAGVTYGRRRPTKAEGEFEGSSGRARVQT